MVELSYLGRTGLPNGTWVRGVGVAMVLAEILGNIVSRQLRHNVRDVPIGAEVLQALMRAPWWPKRGRKP